MRPAFRNSLLLAFLLALPAAAQESEAEEADDKAATTAGEAPADVEARIEALAAEIERLKLAEVVPEAEGSVHGLGPAASKVYRAPRGVSFGGYGEMLYQNYFDDSKDDVADFLRSILYVGYKFNDKFVLNSEIEIEHAKEIFVEFAYIDYLWRPELSLRGGMLLAPMGLINELHEPTVFLGAMRPETESRIIPSTWRENGAGIFGDTGPVSYRAYMLNGLKAQGFNASGLRGGRQKGAKAVANDFAGMARLDFTGIPGLLVGGSVYFGGSGQNLETEVPTLIYEGHLDYKCRILKGVELRGLFAQARLDDVADLNGELTLAGSASVGELLQGWYVQLGYDVLALTTTPVAALTPFVRWEDVNTQLEVPAGFSASPTTENRILTLGVNFYPIRDIVIKAEYQRRVNGDDSDSEQVNALLGYIF